MKRIFCLLMTLCLLFAVPISVHAADIDYNSLGKETLDDTTVKLILQKAQAGDTEARDFLFSLDAFKSDNYNIALEQLSGQKDLTKPARYTFEDGSFVEIGSCAPGSTLEGLSEALKNLQTYDLNSQIVNSIFPTTITDEKYIGVGVGSLYFGAYFIECKYYCPDHNHAYFISCKDRAQAVIPYNVTADGCECTTDGPNTVIITGEYSYSNFGWNESKIKVKFYCFPEFASNYIVRV